MSTITCPSHDELHAYSIGLLSDEVSDAVAAHLASCADCRAGLSTLDDAEDTFMEQLRRPAVVDPYREESQCQVAVARAYALAGTSAESRSEPSFHPRALGEYQLIGELGRGGMGTVYKALHTKLDRVVALKVLSLGRREDRPAISRFEREMRAVGKISHPNVVQAFDAREIEGLPVLIMEYVDGLDLAEIVRRSGPLPTAEACELVRRTALALQCAHEHGLVHRDIKPSNIMLTVAGEVKLLDLGLARFYAEEGSAAPAPAGEETTGTGRTMGTADYMAPEQASDCHRVDIRADVYSLGCTLYKLLSGRAPFSGQQYAGALEKMNAHVHQPVPPIRSIAPDVPDGVVAILERMLAKDPHERFATPAEVAAALEAVCRGAKLAELMERAMAIDEESISLRESDSEGPMSQRKRASEGPMSQPERASEGPLSLRERARVRAVSPLRRRPVLRRILIALAFLGAMAAAFAAGIVITIKRNGSTLHLTVPNNAEADINEQGNPTVIVPGRQESSKASVISAVAELKALQGRWTAVRVEKGADGDATWGGICCPDWYRASLDPATTSRIEIVPAAGENSECFFIMRQGAGVHGMLTGMGGMGGMGGGMGGMGGGTWHFQGFDYRIDPNASPKRIDLIRPTEQLPVALGIYEIDGEDLKIRFARRVPTLQLQDQRPKTFSIEPNSPDVLFVLKRNRGDEEKKIAGAWVVVTKTTNGASVLEGVSSACTFYEATYAPDFSSVEGFPTPTPFLLDATRQPKRIMLLNPGLSGTQDDNGIYQLEGDHLTIARRPGSPPPEKFESTPGSGVTLLVLERPKPKTGTAGAQVPMPQPGTGKGPGDGASTPGNRAPATPPEVAVVHPTARQVTNSTEFTGSLEAAQTAEVKARVAGTLAKVLFKEDAGIKQGDPLFEIDPAPFQAEVDKREADIRLAQARLALATAELNSAKTPSPDDRERMKAQRVEAESAVMVARGAARIAQLNLAATHLTAPINGKIGRPSVGVGSLVDIGKSLATIDSVDPICVVFQVDERTALELRRNHRYPEAGQPVFVGLPDEKGFPHKACFESAAIRIDPATGTERWRALLPNPDGLLLPGMFVRVRVMTSDP